MEKATGWETVETSSLGPAGVFSKSWMSCFCFPLFSLSLILMWSCLLYSKVFQHLELFLGWYHRIISGFDHIATYKIQWVLVCWPFTFTM